MNFDLEKSIAVLKRTPHVLEILLEDLDDEWIYNNEGENTFSPFDVVGHLLHGEKTDWMIRAEIILTSGTEQPFPPYHRFAQFELSKGKTLEQLLAEFRKARNTNLTLLKSLDLNESKLNLKGLHPTLGAVTLKQLLATWVIHDFTHLAQINRVMAKQYKHEMGPWIEFFRLMRV